MINFISFVQEITKIAAETGGIGAFRKQIEPGDILLTSFDRARPGVGGPGSKLGLGEKAFRRVSKKFQGDTEHSAIYVGGGKVVETEPWSGAVKRPLNSMVGVRGGVLAVRPEVSNRERRRAVRRAKQLVGTEYSVPRLARAGLANYVKLKPEKVSDRTKHKYICSTLVGDAYNRVPFNERKPADALMPADFARSDKTQVVSRLRPMPS